MEVRRKLEAVTMTTRKVRDKIMALKPDSAPGPDGLTGHLLQGLADKISPVLALIFSKSLEKGELPADRRSANVTLNVKKGARSKPEIYRSVSLTSIPCKIMGVHCERRTYGPLGEEQPDKTQSAWLHAREILCDQPVGISGIYNTDCGRGKKHGYCVSGLCIGLR